MFLYTFIAFFYIFLYFEILFFGNVKKKVRVGGFELGSVGEPETHLFFFWPKRNHGHWCSDAHIPIVIAKKSKDVCVVINYFDVESWNFAVNNCMLFRIMSPSSYADP